MNLFYEISDSTENFVDNNLKKFLIILNQLDESLSNIDSVSQIVDYFLQTYNHLFYGKKIISIDGNIGIGKSYFLKKLMIENQSLSLISEPVDYWSKIKCSNTFKNCLELYYECLSTKNSFYLFKFQLIVMISKILNIIDQFSKSRDTTFISERCFLSDKWVFVKVSQSTFTSQQLIEYDRIHKKIIDDLYLKTSLFIVYLNADDDEQEIKLCMHRIKQRSRDGEDKISEEYLKKLQSAYLELMSMSKTLPYIKKWITIGQDFCQKADIWDRLTQKLIE